ncbi:MAG: type II toxin-antitoxin system VapB family antitoxin [Nitrospirota bacterium]
MRTTIRLNDRLLQEAKQLAARSGRTLTSVIEEALRALLARPRHPAKRARVRLTTVTGRGPAAGVDLDDTAGLLDLMESRRGSH